MFSIRGEGSISYNTIWQMSPILWSICSLRPEALVVVCGIGAQHIMYCMLGVTFDGSSSFSGPASGIPSILCRVL